MMERKILELEIEPRFCELDGLGHVNNAVPLEWCEQARIPLFRIFTPDLDLAKWRLIIVKNNIDYLKQINFGKSVKLQTSLSKLGNSSLTIVHEIFQDEVKVCHCQCIMIHFDYKTNKSKPIPSYERGELEVYYHSSE